MNRRKFFKRLGQALGVAAVAPAALAVVPKSRGNEFLDGLFANARALAASRPQSDRIDIYTDAATADLLRKAMARYHWQQSYRQQRIERHAHRLS